MILTFTVEPPIKTKTEYIFSFYSANKKVRNFGFRTDEFEIPHGSVWDTLYPLIYLTRNGGPVYLKYDEVKVVFQYPVVKEFVELMKRRCKSQGVRLEVEAPAEIEATAEAPVWNTVVGFGGGKESSLNCGITKELGYSPTMLMGSPKPPTPRKRWDWDDVVFFIPINKGIVDRLIVQMMCGGTLYHGSSLDDTWHTIPWQQYYDIGTAESLTALNDTFTKTGIDRKVIAPLRCLPCAQIPKILCDRYPEVGAKRESVNKSARNEKNMHVSLCEMMGDVSILEHCSPELLVILAREFIPKCNDYGQRNGRMVARLGMCSMLYHLRDHEYLKPIRSLIPDSWDRRFIHYGHFYKNVPKEFEEIFREYLEESPDGTNEDGGIWLG